VWETHRHTHTQRHRQTHDDSIYRASIASHGKNGFTYELGTRIDSEVETSKVKVTGLRKSSTSHGCQRSGRCAAAAAAAGMGLHVIWLLRFLALWMWRVHTLPTASRCRSRCRSNSSVGRFVAVDDVIACRTFVCYGRAGVLHVENGIFFRKFKKLMSQKVLRSRSCSLHEHRRRYSSQNHARFRLVILRERNVAMVTMQRRRHGLINGPLSMYI